MLFITSDDDRLVPPDESEALYAKAGEPKKLVMLKGWGHYEVYAGEAFRQVIEPTLAWYQQYLPARPRLIRQRKLYGPPAVSAAW